MIVNPINSNVVEIPVIQTGCLKAEFDSTYPIHLNGIIRQDEFQQSIANINRAISSRVSLIICGFIFGICIVVGIILFISGGITAVNSRTFGFPILVGVGFAIFVLGGFIMTVGCCLIQTRLTVRMQEAIAKESMKYSTRSPIPCSWRLASTRIVTGRYGYQRAAITNRIVIEIGHVAAQGYGYAPHQFNQGAPQQIPFYSQQNDIPPPPPYNDYSAGGFCSQCGMRRQDSMAKFCSSCGSPFNL